MDQYTNISKHCMERNILLQTLVDNEWSVLSSFWQHQYSVLFSEQCYVDINNTNQMKTEKTQTRTCVVQCLLLF